MLSVGEHERAASTRLPPATCAADGVPHLQRKECPNPQLLISSTGLGSSNKRLTNPRSSIVETNISAGKLVFSHIPETGPEPNVEWDPESHFLPVNDLAG